MARNAGRSRPRSEEHQRYLVGQDPTDIERHRQGMFRGPRYRGGPVLMSALSAVVDSGCIRFDPRGEV